MRWSLAVWSSLVATCAAGLGERDARKFRMERNRQARSRIDPGKIFRREAEAQYLNNKTASFLVKGDGIPDVNFDVGESYAGLLPISNRTDEESKLFFWFFPTTSTNETAKKEIVIWLNGGGLLQENGPFLWQYGTYRPVVNPWSWHRLANMIWVEQPVGTGFSVGKVTAQNEDDVARQFMGFWRNFVDQFDLHGYKVYITGESYAGWYCPYIASNMLDANDTSYFDMKGVLIYDPDLTGGNIQSDVPAVAFVDYWKGLHPFNDSFNAHIHELSRACGYDDYLKRYLTYPPPGPQPHGYPGTDAADDTIQVECLNTWNMITDASLTLNPCWDVYQVATTCPVLWDVLGFPGTLMYLPEGQQAYFNRTDVKTAIHAPLGVNWAECADRNVFVDNRDRSVPAIVRALPSVIDRTRNVIISHGALDFVLIANGTLLGIQNMTWGGQLGFQKRPVEPFYVPYHQDYAIETLAGSGVFGTAHSERGLTYVGVVLSGHMVPQYAPTAAFRQLEFLLGRVDSLSSRQPFTVDLDTPQRMDDMGVGTAP